MEDMGKKATNPSKELGYGESQESWVSMKGRRAGKRHVLAEEAMEGKEGGE